MEKGLVGVPSAGGVKEALKDFGVGAIGGLLFLLAKSLFGGLGVIAAPLIAGSMIKGERGKTIAVMCGFMLLAMAALGTTSTSTSTASSRGEL
jgi:hypothetical protein